MNGSDIRKVREAAKVSQEDLRIALGISHRSAIADIEADRIPVIEQYILRVIGTIAGMEVARRQDSVQ